jgi:hypothetical protein
MAPSVVQASEWYQRLARLRDEMEDAYGEPHPDVREPELIALMSCAASEAARELAPPVAP